MSNNYFEDSYIKKKKNGYLNISNLKNVQKVLYLVLSNNYS